MASAVVKLGRQNLTPDANGRITIPNAPNDPLTQGIVQAGKLAAPLALESRTDRIEMDARFHLDREQLLADVEARLNLRVRLTNHGHELPLDRIADPALILKAELVGGVTTERVIAEDLKLTPVLEVPFQVPADLLKLTLTLRGTVTPATGGDPVKLSADQSYEINGDLKESRIGTAFFSPTAGGHRLEVRGRNGEPLASRAVMLKFTHPGYDETISLQVRTDANGRIDLGRLDGIEWLHATGTDIGTSVYQPKLRTVSPTTHVQTAVGSEIRLPLERASQQPDRLQISLLEMIDGQPIRDHFEKIVIDAGQLVIRGLPPGDFRLSQARHTTEILVSSGIAKDGLIVSRARILPLHLPSNPIIATASAGNDEVRIQIHAGSPYSRVSMVGRRFDSWPWATTREVRPFS
ncbi:MAG: hypothetical protein ACRCXD_04035, partial [Luteolibacter sp.]